MTSMNMAKGDDGASRRTLSSLVHSSRLPTGGPPYTNIFSLNCCALLALSPYFESEMLCRAQEQLAYLPNQSIKAKDVCELDVHCIVSGKELRHLSPIGIIDE